MHKTKIDISEDVRGKMIEILNERLADGLDLKSQAKQAHWNVKGMNFIALHGLFDQVATEVDAHVDTIAERVTTLGGTALGTVRIAAEKSSLNEYPIEITDGRLTWTLCLTPCRISERSCALISMTPTRRAIRTQPTFSQASRERSTSSYGSSRPTCRLRKDR